MRWPPVALKSWSVRRHQCAVCCTVASVQGNGATKNPGHVAGGACSIEAKLIEAKLIEAKQAKEATTILMASGIATSFSSTYKTRTTRAPKLHLPLATAVHSGITI